jgi:hypothetical protein
MSDKDSSQKRPQPTGQPADEPSRAIDGPGGNYTPVEGDEGFLDGQERDSWNAAEQAAGSADEAAEAARDAAQRRGGGASELFAGSPGEEGPAPNIPSSLNMDRRASAARTGRAEFQERLDEHNAAGPEIAGGDVDADWASAYSVGDEAPGGDNPTPDQDIVDEVGRALGVEYEDNEELRGGDKLEDRDRKRWELDPASSEDWEDRNRDRE